MAKVSTFKKRVISSNDQEKANLKIEFQNLAKMVKDFQIDLNAKTDSLYNLADMVALIENPRILNDVFIQANKSALKARAEKQGVTLNDLEALENVQLTKVQEGFMATAKKLKQSLLFKGMTSKDWYVDGDIQISEKVEEVFEELTTEFTKAPIASSRLDVLEAFEKHIELYPEDKLAMIQVIRHGSKFVNYGQ